MCFFRLFCCSRHGYDPPLSQFSFPALPNTPIFMTPSSSSCNGSKHSVYVLIHGNGECCVEGRTHTGAGDHQNTRLFIFMLDFLEAWPLFSPVGDTTSPPAHVHTDPPHSRGSVYRSRNTFRVGVLRILLQEPRMRRSRALPTLCLSYSHLPPSCTDHLGSLGAVGCCRHVHE